MCNCADTTEFKFNRDVVWGRPKPAPVHAPEWANVLLGVRWDGHLHAVWVDDKDRPTKVNAVGRSPNDYEEITPSWEVLRVISERST